MPKKKKTPNPGYGWLQGTIHITGAARRYFNPDSAEAQDARMLETLRDADNVKKVLQLRRLQTTSSLGALYLYQIEVKQERDLHTPAPRFVIATTDLRMLHVQLEFRTDDRAESDRFWKDLLEPTPKPKDVDVIDI